MIFGSQSQFSVKREAQRGVRILLLALVLVSLLQPFVKSHAQQGPAIPSAVSAVFKQMSPEERVGQLFLVTFTGRDVSPNTPIYDLILNHRIGGVILLSANDNFSPAPDTAPAAQELINQLQQAQWSSIFQKITDPVSGEEKYPTYEPLFIGLSQEGDGYPTDQLLSGLTPLPSEMAIGATWNTDLAQRVGQVMGSELSALGVNLYLGLSLDVLDSPNPQAGNDFGTRAFGGDPYWVGEMGRAYLSGLHTGSNGHLLVIAKHFPGRGSADRSTETEISTVRKSLEQLKQIELAPFFAVTGNAPASDSTADGLLVSHIRYQGFQGNIRATTRPISFDAQALTELLALPQFAGWRTNGGLIVSDDLGSQAVREFYSLAGDGFSARTVARDAFLAGNDLLYLGQINYGSSADNYSTMLDVINFFSKKYREDTAFAARVDASVLRILTRKFQLYGAFSVSRVITSADSLKDINTSQDLTFEIARNSATLVSPDAQDLATVLPAPPKLGDRLVFITDSNQVKQCSTCSEQPTLAVDALQQVVLRLYGPEGGKQTNPTLLSSYSFDTLASLLDGTDTSFLGSDIDRADWIVISISDSTRNQPQLLSRFLLERQALLQNKRVILFSFGAPYYLDATDISKLTAFFALYSKQPAFVDVAARLLYEELTPQGSSPVSIAGVGYDLISVTAPDVSQIIPLSLDLDAGVVTPSSNTPQATQVPLYKIGDTIAIRTGVILDHNRNPVPDGTVVRFSMDLTGEGGGILQQVESVTTKGIARASFGLDKPGLLQIHAESEPAIYSELLQLDVSTTGSVAVTLIVPVLSETVVPTPALPPVIQDDSYITPEGYPTISAWLFVIVLILGMFALAYWSGVRIYQKPRFGVRMALGSSLGALAVYNYFAFGLFNSRTWAMANGLNGIFLFVVLGACVGWMLVFFQIRRE